jgi:DNA-binding Xre family transcriptional regulator
MKTTPTTTAHVQWDAWNLQRQMNKAGMENSDLQEALAELGVVRDISGIRKMNAHRTRPMRVDLTLLGALCEIFHCSPNELFENTGEGVPVNDVWSPEYAAPSTTYPIPPYIEHRGRQSGS